MPSAAWLLPVRHKYLIQVFLSAVALVEAGIFCGCASQVTLCQSRSKSEVNLLLLEHPGCSLSVWSLTPGCRNSWSLGGMVHGLVTPTHGSHKTSRYFAGGAESLTRAKEHGLMEMTCSYQAHFFCKAGKKKPSMAD